MKHYIYQHAQQRAKKIVLGFVALVLVNFSTLAVVPEPQVTLFGKVFNNYQGVQTRVANGGILWQLKSIGEDGKEYGYSATIESVAEGLYDYRIDIPQRLIEQAVTPEFIQSAASSLTVAINSNDKVYRHNLIFVDGHQAQIVAPGSEKVTMSQAARSQHVELDLYISKPPVDSDGDGLPDTWELKYFGSTTGADPDGDEDEDLLSNLEEYEYSSVPVADTEKNSDNRFPSLVHNQMQMAEQGTSLFRPEILDSDTFDKNIKITISGISDSVNLSYLAGGIADYDHGYQFEQGDELTALDLLNGHVIVRHRPESIDAQDLMVEPEYIEFTVNDGDNPVATYKVLINLFKPNAMKGTSTQMWFDASVDQSKFEAYENKDWEATSESTEEWFGRAGRGEMDLLHHIDVSGWNWIDVDLSNSGPAGQQVINLDSQHYYESWAKITSEEKPFEFNDNLAYFAVYNTRGTKDQILTHDMSSEFAITSHDDPIYPNRLRFSKEGQKTVYSSMPVKQGWGISAFFQDNNKTVIEQENKVTGFNLEDQSAQQATSTSNEGIDDTVWGTSSSIGGKVIGSANNDDYTMVDGFEGSIGEILMMNCGNCQSVKWRIYGYLQSKWFDHVVVDHSETTYMVNAMSASSSYIGVPEAVKDEYASIDEGLLYKGDEMKDHINAKYQEYSELYGTDKNYLFIGGSAFNQFVGGGKDDILVGGEGGDWLTGLGGSDLFVVKAGNVVVDFNIAEDTLDLSNLLNIVDPSIPLNKYINLQVDMYDTYVNIDADGDGSGFTDGQITIANIAIRNADISSLWAKGLIVANTARPELAIGFKHAGTIQINEQDEQSVIFELASSGAPLPVGLFLPVATIGDAKLGHDFKLEIAAYDQQKDLAGEPSPYSWQELKQNGLPLNIKPGDYSASLRVTAMQDYMQEDLETIELKLMPLNNYDLTDNSSLQIAIGDGLTEVAISTDKLLVVEGLDSNSTIILRREGALDVKLDVKLKMIGSAQNGIDYGFIAENISFQKNMAEVSFDVSAYLDTLEEGVEFLEIALVNGENYQANDQASVKIAIFESSGFSDVDNDNMNDIWEIQNGLNINMDDQLADPDNDGLTNIKEYNLALNPNANDSDGDGVVDKLDRAANDASDATEISIVGKQILTTNVNQLYTFSGDKFDLLLTLQNQVLLGTAANNIDGFGFRLHFNSQQFSFNQFNQVYDTDKILQSTTAQIDIADFDHNPLTDKYVEIRWDNSANNWQTPTDTLAKATFSVLTDVTEAQSISFSASQLTSGYEFKSTDIEVLGLIEQSFDLDDDGQVVGETDTLMIMRYLSGIRGTSLVVDPFDTSTSIEQTLAGITELLDIDGNGKVEALVDGLLLSRCLAGYEGQALIDGVISETVGRNTAEQITQYCNKLIK